MTENVKQDEQERHRSKMAKRKAARAGGCVQDGRREGADHRPHRHGQGQIDRGLRHGLARAGRGKCPRRGAVHQGHVVDRRAECAGTFGAWRAAHAGRGLHLGDAGQGPRHRRGAGWEKAKELIRDPELAIVLDEINIALRYDYLPLAEVVEFLKRGSPIPCGRDRAQRQRELIEAADLVTEMTLVKHPFR